MPTPTVVNLPLYLPRKTLGVGIYGRINNPIAKIPLGNGGGQSYPTTGQIWPHGN